MNIPLMHFCDNLPNIMWRHTLHLHTVCMCLYKIWLSTLSSQKRKYSLKIVWQLPLIIHIFRYEIIQPNDSPDSPTYGFHFTSHHMWFKHWTSCKLNLVSKMLLFSIHCSPHLYLQAAWGPYLEHPFSSWQFTAVSAPPWAIWSPVPCRSAEIRYV